jgi:hypothetical protein
MAIAMLLMFLLLALLALASVIQSMPVFAILDALLL